MSLICKRLVPKAHLKASLNLKVHLYSYPFKIASIRHILSLCAHVFFYTYIARLKKCIHKNLKLGKIT